MYNKFNYSKVKSLEDELDKRSELNERSQIDERSEIDMDKSSENEQDERSEIEMDKSSENEQDKNDVYTKNKCLNQHTFSFNNSACQTSESSRSINLRANHTLNKIPSFITKFTGLNNLHVDLDEQADTYDKKKKLNKTNTKNGMTQKRKDASHLLELLDCYFGFEIQNDTHQNRLTNYTIYDHNINLYLKNENCTITSLQKSNSNTSINTKLITNDNYKNFNKKLNTNESDYFQCSICLEEITEKNKQSFLPCFHRFHTACIVKWLRRSDLCPICQLNIRQFLKLVKHTCKKQTKSINLPAFSKIHQNKFILQPQEHSPNYFTNNSIKTLQQQYYKKSFILQPNQQSTCDNQKSFKPINNLAHHTTTLPLIKTNFCNNNQFKSNSNFYSNGKQLCTKNISQKQLLLPNEQHKNYLCNTTEINQPIRYRNLSHAPISVRHTETLKKKSLFENRKLISPICDFQNSNSLLKPTDHNLANFYKYFPRTKNSHHMNLKDNSNSSSPSNDNKDLSIQQTNCNETLNNRIFYSNDYTSDQINSIPNHINQTQLKNISNCNNKNSFKQFHLEDLNKYKPHRDSIDSIPNCSMTYRTLNLDRINCGLASQPLTERSFRHYPNSYRSYNCKYIMNDLPDYKLNNFK